MPETYICFHCLAELHTTGHLQTATEGSRYLLDGKPLLPLTPGPRRKCHYCGVLTTCRADLEPSPAELTEVHGGTS
jgi:hypothetical protein